MLTVGSTKDSGESSTTSSKISASSVNVNMHLYLLLFSSCLLCLLAS